MNKSPEIEHQRDLLESALAQSMTVYGVTVSVGRIFSTLYFSKSPMTLKDIQSHVAMSKASVSNGVRELMETEMVTKVWKKSERQDYYVAEKDFFKNFILYFIKMLRKENNLILNAVEQTEPLLKEIEKSDTDSHIKEEVEKDLQLLEHARTYLDWTMRVANAMDSGEIFKYFPKETSKETDNEHKKNSTNSD